MSTETALDKMNQSDKFAFKNHNYGKPPAGVFYAKYSAEIDAVGLTLQIGTAQSGMKWPKINVDYDLSTSLGCFIQSALAAAERDVKPSFSLESSLRYVNVAPTCIQSCRAGCTNTKTCGASVIFRRCLKDPEALEKSMIDADKFTPWVESRGGSFVVVYGKMKVQSISWDLDHNLSLKLTPSPLLILDEGEQDDALSKIWQGVSLKERVSKRRSAGKQRLEQQRKRSKVSDCEVTDGESN